MVGQRFIIDFCIVSANLFSFMVDVLDKRGAKLSTDHHLVVCILSGLNHPRTRKQFRAGRAYKIKWELPADKKVKHTFASKVASLFRKLPDYIDDVESEWNLNLHSLHTQLLVVVANVWEVKRVVVRKEMLGMSKSSRSYP